MVRTNALYVRLLKFAHMVFQINNKLPKNIVSYMLCKQILRSSSSVGANYTESIEARYLKDRSNKINIARKEVKETVFWLDLISLEFSTIDVTSEKSEAIEIAKILATIQRKIDNSLDS